MIKIISVWLMAQICCSALFAQNLTTDKVPSGVSKTFRAKFPDAKQENWAKNEEGKYEAVFFYGKKKQAALFDSAGTWLQTETEMSYSLLPSAVFKAIGKQFPGFAIQDAYERDTPEKGILYVVTIMKGKENYDVVFTPKGEMLSKEAGKVEDE